MYDFRDFPENGHLHNGCFCKKFQKIYTVEIKEFTLVKVNDNLGCKMKVGVRVRVRINGNLRLGLMTI